MIDTVSNDIVFMKRDWNSEGKTEIMLKNGRMITTEIDPEKLLNQTLIYLGSSIKARRTTAKKIFNIKQFIPVVIDSDIGMTFFPLHKQSDYCRYYINSYYFLDYTEQQIIFTNKTRLKISLPEAFVRRQYEKSLSMMDSQRKIREQKINYDF
ncbi:competence protein ComK [Macrococcus lamae]|uniref:Competence protein ComK n=1 Tax=Macrococcus lamae TaxID=198484 RepID=A0A4R6BW39_9STAP|nr:competence protein ComK [Macrococcus lamae]TDM12419.1 hypothetical protein ERX29_03590 [Macrococcus lamae]